MKAASADPEYNLSDPESGASASTPSTLTSTSTSTPINTLENVMPGLPFDDENDFLKMFNNVNKLMKENPQMIKEVNKCIGNIFENKDLMNNLVNEIKQNIENK
jgi:hypothetical protein